VRAVWYDQQGPAGEVLHGGDLPDPEPDPGEVRVRVRFPGVNPGDTKKRRGWLGSEMPFPRVIPHSDGAGVVDATGGGVDPARIGHRVWIYGAQSYRRTWPWICPPTSPTRSARAWASLASPPTERFSPTARSTG